MSRLPPPFGPFEPIRRLGAGGMAETFEAIRRGPGSFEQRVCIKRILPAFEDDKEFVEAFLREATTSAQLRHANIVQVLDFGVADGSHYLALELIDGMDLRALANANGPLSAGLVTLVAMDLAAALHHAHLGDADKRPVVVHRDLSPSNVLVSVAGEVKLVDFGIAKALGGTHRTATGVIKGKVPYLPPEYIEHATFDPRGDLFSLGVMLYELLAGQRPFDGESDFDTIRRIMSGTRPALAQLCPDAPPALVTCIEGLLAVKPEERTDSAATLLEALPVISVPLARKQLSDLVRIRTAPTLVSPGAAPLAPSDAHERTLPAPPRSPRSAPPPATRTQAAEPPSDRVMDRKRRGPWIALAAALAVALSVLGVAIAFKVAQRPASTTSAAPPLPAREPRPTPTKAVPAAAEQAASTAQPVLRSADAIQPESENEGMRSSRSASLRVVAIPFGDVWIDGKAMGHAPVETKLAPGSHNIEVGDGRPAQRRTLQLAPGQSQNVVFRVDAE